MIDIIGRVKLVGHLKPAFAPIGKIIVESADTSAPAAAEAPASDKGDGDDDGGGDDKKEGDGDGQ
jgi:hypothetical protein